MLWLCGGRGIEPRRGSASDFGPCPTVCLIGDVVPRKGHFTEVPRAAVQQRHTLRVDDVQTFVSYRFVGPQELRSCLTGLEVPDRRV